MKKILLFVVLSVSLFADLSINYSLSTTHVKYGECKNEYEFNEDNNILGIEYKKGNNIIGINTFTNSFYNRTFGVYYGHVNKIKKNGYFVYRIGLLKGYNCVDKLESVDGKNEFCFVNPTVFYEDYSLLVTVGLGYNFNKHLTLETNVISNAITTSVKYTF